MQRSPRSGIGYWILASILIIVLAVISFIIEQLLSNLYCGLAVRCLHGCMLPDWRLRAQAS